MTKEVRKERTGWRDEALSRRHRDWGWDCPMIDIDFLCVEYDQARAVAIVEYKHERATEQHSNHPSYRALIDLGDRAKLPVFAVRYASDFSWWKVTALNQQAKRHTIAPTMNENQYVAFLYALRGKKVVTEETTMKTDCPLCSHALDLQYRTPELFWCAWCRRFYEKRAGSLVGLERTNQQWQEKQARS